MTSRLPGPGRVRTTGAWRPLDCFLSGRRSEHTDSAQSRPRVLVTRLALAPAVHPPTVPWPLPHCPHRASSRRPKSTACVACAHDSVRLLTLQGLRAPLWSAPLSLPPGERPVPAEKPFLPCLHPLPFSLLGAIAPGASARTLSPAGARPAQCAPCASLSWAQGDQQAAKGPEWPSLSSHGGGPAPGAPIPHNGQRWPTGDGTAA